MENIINHLNGAITNGNIWIEKLKEDIERGIATAKYPEDFKAIEQKSREIQETMIRIQTLEQSLKMVKANQ